MVDLSEKQFESDIESSMVAHGWRSEKFQEIGYDAHLGLCPEKLLHFVKQTQEKTWEQFEQRYGMQADEKFLQLFNKEVTERGLLDVLRHGVRDRGIVLKVVIFKPVSSLNDMLLKQYHCNEFTIVRQFAYSAYHHNTIDIVLMVNGIPVVAMELKNQLTGQNVEHAKRQFMQDRDPSEKVFGFNQRFLVYFAVDTFNVAMTTKLAKNKTFFLPFNQGSHGAGQVGGAGNPTSSNGYATAYLWENVLTPDSLMDILQHFMNVQGDVLIFPRFHQLDVVRKLVADAKENGVGKNYLIQHSAGSGKSNSIAWLAYHLATISLPNNEPLYHSVIVVTDRTVLDRQLQNTITSFDHTPGFVETIDDTKHSKDLKDAINDGKRVIITTLQKFPVIYDEVDDMSGRRFAVIVDEAHSSQSGSSAQKMKTALSDKDEIQRQFEEHEGTSIDTEDFLNKQLMNQGKHHNISFFAFTATPKNKTLELFGTEKEDGTRESFHTYSMRQAIDEGFILDVLKNYMTYEESWHITKSIVGNPEVSSKQASKAIAKFVSNHEQTIAEKSEIIVDQIQNQTINKINGHGKAMLVTSSREQAVRYMKAITNLIEKYHYKWCPLVAFSGELTIDDESYTEVGMNRTVDGQTVQENQLKEVFHEDPYRLLIVAEKYQTGFDEPLLHTMFVDKKLRDIKAVQTLSRLNRTTKGKSDTFVLDFVNSPEDIAEAFQPYYERTTLASGVNVNDLYQLQKELHNAHIYTQQDIDKVLSVMKQEDVQEGSALSQLANIYQAVMHRYETELVDEEKDLFRKNAKQFVKWYDYISQLNRNFDKQLLEEKLFIEQLIHFFPTNHQESINIEDTVTLEFYRLREGDTTDIHLLKEEGEVYNSVPTSATSMPEEITLLDDIINKINEQFPNDFTEDDRVAVEELNDYFVEHTPQKIMKMAQENTYQMFDKEFKDECQNHILELYMTGQMASDKLVSNQEYITVVCTNIGNAVWQKARV